MDVCTVIAKNYLPAARVLADSLAEHHPGVTLHVLVIDEWEGFIDPARERFEIVDPEAIGVPDLARMRSLYTVLEYSTAVKPWLLEKSPHQNGRQRQPIPQPPPRNPAHARFAARLIARQPA